ncbi:hypothetical protein [Actinoplanes sp. GCM10030250]|uniref:hypothetical protein n=1 Tax=Actinoplanes sp. GCM10030250 TaxID=3273376 RepID=UPI003610D3EC
MWSRKYRLMWAGIAVFVLAAALLISYGFIEALMLILAVGFLIFMYWLRRYARAELLYRRHEQAKHAEHEQISRGIQESHRI